MSKGKGMLVALPERWDEACFAVPALRALSRKGLIGGYVCHEDQEAFWKIISDLPYHLYHQKTPTADLSKRVGTNWEATLCWEEALPAKVFSKLGIDRRLGPNQGKLTKLLTHAIDVAESPTEHRVRLYLNTAEALGVKVDRPEFFTPAPVGIPAEPKTILLCPGSDFGLSYEWPLDRWQELAELLLEQGKRITIAGVVGGRGRGKILAQQLGKDVDFFHTSPLAASLPLLAAHQVLIAADGSLPHLAAHAGSTCVTLFGPNDSVWKRPLGKRHVVVKKHVECAPCLSPKCLMDGRCQTELEVDDVLKAIPKSF